MQNAEIVAFGRERVELQIAQTETGRWDPAALGRGIADQIALACHLSPFHDSLRLATARALHHDLPTTAGLLAAGRISERVAELVVSHTSHLQGEARRLVDTQLGEAGLVELSVGRAEALVKKCAYDADPAAYLARGRTARADRRVSLRPAPDTMSVLSGLLPVEQGVACLAALRSPTDTVIAIGDGEGRSRDQVMADTLVERLTGQATASGVHVEVGIVMSLDTLSTPTGAAAPRSSGTARSRPGSPATSWPAPSGNGGGGARSPLARAGRWSTPTRGGACSTGPGPPDHGSGWWPVPGSVLRRPDPPPRPHPRPPRGRAHQLHQRARVCARGNHVREMPGWTVDLVDDGLGDRPHTVRTTTPTDTPTSAPPDQPRRTPPCQNELGTVRV